MNHLVFILFSIMLCQTASAMPSGPFEGEEKDGWAASYNTSIGRIQRSHSGIMWYNPFTKDNKRPFHCKSGHVFSLTCRMVGLKGAVLTLDHRLRKKDFEDQLSKMLSSWEEIKE